MKNLHGLFRAYERFDGATMPVDGWKLFIRLFSLALLAYWLHLGHDLNDWLGKDGFRLESPASEVFRPLPSPWPHLLWWSVLAGTILLFFSSTLMIGALLAGGGFFYATMCDLPSTAALNMHFLFALIVILWSVGLKKFESNTMRAWPALLIRLYLVIVYFGSGWRKTLYGDWLENPNVLFHCLTGYFTAPFMRLIYPALPVFTWTALQYLTVAFELGAPLILLYPPFRKLGLIMGCLLHVGIAMLMKDLFYFSFQMLTFYIPFLIPIFYSTPSSAKSARQPAT